MLKKILRTLAFGGILMLAGTTLNSCAPKAHCAAIGGTGNSKPKYSNKPQDGLVSKKMAKAMAKSKKKDASPIKKRKLSFDN